MNEEALAKWKRAAELGQLTSTALSDLLTAAGWRLAGRNWKQDKVQAILHLEGFEVQEEIVKDLGMERLDPVTA